jgi:choline kinase
MSISEKRMRESEKLGTGRSSRTAVILAAGIASRLRPLTDHTPKCLLAPGGKRILHRTIASLHANGIMRVVIVTGYLHTLVEEFVRRHWSTLEVIFVHNPDYASTNNIHSLWLARDAVGTDEMLLLDSDILFHPGIIAALLDAPHADCIALNTAHPVGEEEIKVRLDGDGGRILAISKTVPVAEAAGESIGIERFSPTFTARLFMVIEEMVRREGRSDVFYEAAFERVIAAGRPLHAVDISAWPCMELDTVEDFRRAEREIIPLLDADGRVV